MSFQTGGQGHRMPFDSPMTNLTTTSSTQSSPRSRRQAEENRPKMKNGDLSVAGSSAIPSLNIITNFSPKKSSQKAHERNLSIQERRKQTKKLTDTPKELDPMSALSTSDGTLLIGISLQPELVEAHNMNNINRKSIAPEIVITPAGRLEDPWKTERKMRPRSSMYSQATRLFPTGGHANQQGPPIPPIPSHFPSDNHQRRLSVASWHTDFSDDNDREVICRRYSGESQLGIIRNASIHTTKRRSEGWWNTILSPIFGRSNTFSNRKAPPLPIQDEKGQFEPEELLQPNTDLIGKNRQSRSSIWTDLSRLDAQRQTLAFFHDSPTDTRQPALPKGNKELSPELVQEGGFGLASEYYEATWHDAYSTTPFFECQGHDCAQKVTYRHGKTIGGPDADAPQNGLTEKNLTLLSSQASDSERSLNQPTISTFSRAVSPKLPHQAHLRNKSNETDIDEEPDAFSEMHESHSKPSSKAASPMPETQSHFRQTVRAMTPEVTASSNVSTPRKSPAKKATSANRAGGLERRLLTPEPTMAIATSPGRVTRSIPVSSKATSDSSSVQGRSVPRDPFDDMAYCASPEALTPGLQKEFINRNAIPMEPPKSVTTSTRQESMTRSIQNDPLNIDAPRKAPIPPRIETSGTQVHTNPLGSNPAPKVAMYGLPGSRPVHHESSSSLNTFSKSNVPYNFQADNFKDVSLEFAPPPGKVDQTQSNEKKQQEKAKRGCQGFCCGKRNKDEPKQKRKRWYFLIGGALLGLIILVIVLVLTLTLRRSDVSVQTSFLNITGFPPIPTGVATIAQPIAAVEESKCVAPNTLWSCAVPKEQQSDIAPNAPNQPNFRLEIRFQNGSSVLNSSNTIQARSVANPVSAGTFMRRHLYRARDSFTSALFSPSPQPPSQEDQIFLGNTTDNNTAPFQGEQTPFFISFLPTTSGKSKRALEARDDSDPFPNVTALIPAPSVNSDGTAAAANLVSYPSAQPLMLYNRGRTDEHYGFYTYMDRSIFLKSTDLLNSTGPDIPDNDNGGASKSAADARCTWTQTRFLVQIWTNAGNALQLLNSNNNSTKSSSSATDFTQPGSFPYPISITLDRHGGDIKQKMIYCYGMDLNGRIVSSAKQVHLENRNSGGPGLINPAGGIFGQQVNVSIADGGPGGIDGGFGGCRCQWRNWVQV